MAGTRVVATLSFGGMPSQLSSKRNVRRTRANDLWSNFSAGMLSELVRQPGDRRKTFTDKTVMDAPQRRWTLR